MPLNILQAESSAGMTKASIPVDSISCDFLDTFTPTEETEKTREAAIKEVWRLYQETQNRLLPLAGTVSVFSEAPALCVAGEEIPYTPTERDRATQEAQALFEAAKGHIFEDGMESEFSRGLISFIAKYGDIARQVLTDLILDSKADVEVASEALRWVGLMDHPLSQTSRLELLKQSLHSSSAQVRDGALLGIAFLDDPRALDSLRHAITQERSPILRRDMERVLEQLENTRLCHYS